MTSTPSIKVRVAAANERDALEALQWRASLQNPGDRDALLAHRDAIELPLVQIEAGGVFVAETEEGVVGFAAILPRDDGDAELDALFVEPDSWRRGIGRILVNHCCVAAKANGAKSLHVIGNPHAEAFYLSCGFVMRGVTEMRFGKGFRMDRTVA
jgi:N-acetylglutamate synthase-like GNAT family acetyltransferase